MTGWREVGSKSGHYSAAQVYGSIDEGSGHGYHRVLYVSGKVMGNGRFEKKTMGSGCFIWPS
jgi:hypothetical protein